MEEAKEAFSHVTKEKDKQRTEESVVRPEPTGLAEKGKGRPKRQAPKVDGSKTRLQPRRAVDRHKDDGDGAANEDDAAFSDIDLLSDRDEYADLGAEPDVQLALQEQQQQQQQQYHHHHGRHRQPRGGLQGKVACSCFRCRRSRALAALPLVSGRAVGAVASKAPSPSPSPSPSSQSGDRVPDLSDSVMDPDPGVSAAHPIGASSDERRGWSFLKREELEEPFEIVYSDEAEED